MANVQSINTVAFPRSKKRGAKVRTGPCARVIPLPGIYIGDELEERFEFISDHAEDWLTEDPNGTKSVKWDRRAWRDAIDRVFDHSSVTEKEKRKQVALGRARIERRNQIKAYLERRGVDLDKVRNAEDALFALFGFMEANT